MAILWDSYVSPQALTAFVRSVPVDQNFILNQILPDQYDDVLEVEFGDSVVTTRAAKARAWDAPPMPGRRDSFATRKVKLPAVSQMMGRGERDRLEIERLRSGGQATTAIERAIFDDAENNTRSVLARVELMRGDLLADGKITLAELGGLEADFQVPGTHIVTAAVPWTTIATANVLGDIRAWGKVYRASNGFGFGGMIMPEDVLYAMLQNQAIRDLWSSVSGRPSVVTLEQMNQTLTSNRLPPVLFTYDAQTVVDEVATSILPVDKVIFVPPTGIPLGFTQWGMTATALEINGRQGVDVLPSPAGMVAVVDKDLRPPYRESAYVDATVMPYLSRRTGLFVADVA
jgi:Phage major capsid protein E